MEDSHQQNTEGEADESSRSGSLLSLPETHNIEQAEQEIGIPMYVEMKELHSREETFKNKLWKKQRKVKKFVADDKIFAKAGFFYGGLNDEIICFYCGGKLGSIQENDQPVREHMKYYPTCEFLINEYTPAAIALVNEKYRNIDRPFLPRDTIKEVAHNPDNLPPPVDGVVDQVKLLEEAMASENAAKVLTMGFEPEVIKDAMNRKISKDNCYYESVDAILEQIMPE